MSSFSEGQTHQLMDALEAAGYTRDHITKLGQSGGLLIHFRLVLEGIAEVVQKSVEKVKEVKTYLRHLFAFKLGPVNGKDTYAVARKVFRGYFAPEFESFGIVFSGVAPETEVAALELVRDGRFTQFLGNAAEELEKLRLLGSQFLNLCRDNPDKLQRNGYVNFFVLTKGDEVVAEDLSNVFVADVFVDDVGGLSAYLRHVSFDLVWGSDYGHRVFSPQQALVSSQSA